MNGKERVNHLLGQVLLSIGKHSPLPWTIGHATQGTQIFGEPGSGKSTGSGRTIAMKFLEHGFGGLVLSAKPEERSVWEGYFADAGRTLDDLIVVGLDQPHRFNFLDYEYSRPGRGGRLTQNLESLFMTAMESNESPKQGSDPYWQFALSQLLTNAIDTVALSGNGMTLRAITDAILTAPRGLLAPALMLEQSACAQMLKQAAARDLSIDERADLSECIEYWASDFAGLAERTRSIIVSSFTSRATPLMRGPLRRIFCGQEPSTFVPEDTHRGKVILLDLPVKEFGAVGRFAQVLFKTVWQRATERRTDMLEFRPGPNGLELNPHFDPDFRPVFLWADESQHFVSAEDLYFQATARSALAATVYLTQNISNYYATIGGRDARAATDGLLGSLVTKIFHANSDPATNEWAERLFGRITVSRRGASIGWEQHQGMTTSLHESFEPVVPAYRFTKLKKGGPPDMQTECIVYLGGRITSATGTTCVEHTFSQPSNLGK